MWPLILISGSGSPHLWGGPWKNWDHYQVHLTRKGMSSNFSLPSSAELQNRLLRFLGLLVYDYFLELSRSLILCSHIWTSAKNWENPWLPWMLPLGEPVEREGPQIVQREWVSVKNFVFWVLIKKETCLLSNWLLSDWEPLGHCKILDCQNHSDTQLLKNVSQTLYHNLRLLKEIIPGMT